MPFDQGRPKGAKASVEEEERAQRIADLRSCFTEKRRTVVPQTKEQERASAELHRLVFSRDPPLDARDQRELKRAIAEVERVWPSSLTSSGGTLATLLQAAKLLLTDDD